MIKLSLALIAFVLCLALPAAYAATSKPTGPLVAKSLLRQLNSGPDGRITKGITCARVKLGSAAFECDARSVVSTHLGAHVTVTGAGLRTTWAPIQG